MLQMKIQYSARRKIMTARDTLCLLTITALQKDYSLPDHNLQVLHQTEFEFGWNIIKTFIIHYNWLCSYNDDSYNDVL